MHIWHNKNKTCFTCSLESSNLCSKTRTHLFSFLVPPTSPISARLFTCCPLISSTSYLLELKLHTMTLFNQEIFCGISETGFLIFSWNSFGNLFLSCHYVLNEPLNLIGLFISVYLFNPIVWPNISHPSNHPCINPL